MNIEEMMDYARNAIYQQKLRPEEHYYQCPQCEGLDPTEELVVKDGQRFNALSCPDCGHSEVAPPRE